MYIYLLLYTPEGENFAARPQAWFSAAWDLWAIVVGHFALCPIYSYPLLRSECIRLFLILLLLKVEAEFF